MTTEATPITNPYVGPRTFTYAQRHLFFGREREARDLLARVLSERLLLFYAQSGAGKSSLLHTRLIPQLAEKGFVVLPVARVSGELPAGVAQVDNIYTFNLMLSIDKGDDPARLAHVTLIDFFARLTRRTLVNSEGEEYKGWVYDATQAPAPPTTGPSARRYALLVDQFEEIITASPERWREREAFFRQIDQAMRGDPNLWVVFTLREDYVASLDPYAPLLADRLRARFYMERMGVEAAVAAVKQPAALVGQPFAEGVAQALVDNLRRIKVIGQTEEQLGQYIEPVQLQVVCYQLWEKVTAAGKDVSGEITTTDLQQSGDVDTALADFYEQALDAARKLPGVNLSERQLRIWFDEQLITDANTRGTVYRDAEETAGMSNVVVDALQARFLLRTELRAGGAWVELVHDRFVGPIRRANVLWLNRNLHPLTQAAQEWAAAGRNPQQLHSGLQLASSINELQTKQTEFGQLERDFVEESQRAEIARINHEYEQLPDDEHRSTLQRIMLRMVNVESNNIVRRRVPRVELVYPTTAENERVETVIRRLVTAQFLLENSDSDGSIYIEPVQDLLIQTWDHLLLWRQAAGGQLALQRRLTRAAQEWQHADERIRANLLWENDPDLPQILPNILEQADTLDTILSPTKTLWPSTDIEKIPEWLTALELRFIIASVRQRVMNRRRVTMLMLGVFIGLTILTIFAFIQRNTAQLLAEQSSATGLAVNALLVNQGIDPDLAIALALKANQIENPPEAALMALLRLAYVPGTIIRFVKHQNRITDVALSPDGHTALSAAVDQRVLLWDIGTQAILQQLDAQQVISITQVAYSPSGDTALLGSADGSISVWELATGTIRQRLTADHAAQITALAYSADGQTALSGDSDGALILWDVASGTMTRSLATHPNGVSAVALSPDGRTALSGGYDANVMLWNLADGELLRSIEVFGGRILTVAYDPTNRYIIAGSTDYTVRAWSLATWQIVGRVDLSAHTQNIVSIAIAPDGITVASSASDGSIRLWDLQVNAPIGTLVAHRAPVISLAFSGDSRSLLSGSRDNTVRLWDVHGPTQIRHYPIEPRLTGGGPLIDTTNNLAIDATQHLALSGARGVALLWNYDTGEEARRFPLNSTPELVRNGLVFQVKAYDSTVGNQDGDGIANVELSILDATGQTVYTHEEKFAVYCAFGGDTQACDAWDFARADYRWPSNNEQPGDPIHSGLYTLRAVIHAADGKSATVERTLMIQLPDSASASPLLTTVDVPPSRASTPASSALVAQISQAGTRTTLISAVALHPDGEHALVSDGSRLIAWNLATDEKMLLPRGHNHRIFNVAYTQDGHTALSTDEAGVVIAWNGETGQQLWRRPLAHDSDLWSIAFTGDGQHALTGYEDHSVILWDLTTGEELQHFPGHQDAVYWVAISPDESKGLTGAADRSVILWDLASGQAIRRFEGHSVSVLTVAFSPDGRTLLSGGGDQTVRLWNSETGAEIFRYEGHTSPIQNVLFLPGGSQILSRAKDGELILWGLPPLDSTALQTWTHANRYVRDLTCDERLLYNVVPLCQNK